MRAHAGLALLRWLGRRPNFPARAAPLSPCCVRGQEKTGEARADYGCVCASCGRVHFPRTCMSPAVIVRLTQGEARPSRPHLAFPALQLRPHRRLRGGGRDRGGGGGPGSRREEAGTSPTTCVDMKSQPWPFPYPDGGFHRGGMALGRGEARRGRDRESPFLLPLEFPHNPAPRGASPATCFEDSRREAAANLASFCRQFFVRALSRRAAGAFSWIPRSRRATGKAEAATIADQETERALEREGDDNFDFGAGE